MNEGVIKADVNGTAIENAKKYGDTLPDARHRLNGSPAARYRHICILRDILDVKPKNRRNEGFTY